MPETDMIQLHNYLDRFVQLRSN